MSKQNSFDFLLTQRQVGEVFDLYLKEQSSVLGLFMRNGLLLPAGTNNKYERLESQLTPKARDINGAISSGTLSTGTPQNITFDSTVGLRAEDVIRFVHPTTGSPVGNLQVRIVAVSSATVATGVIYGGTTDATIPDNAVAKFIANLVEENKKSDDATNNREPGTEYNHFQIFDEYAELSNTAVNTLTYGNSTDIAAQLKQSMYKFEQKLAEQLQYGRRVARTGKTSGLQGSFAGLDFFLSQAGGNSFDATGAAISSTAINNVIEEIKKDGGSVNTIMCNYNQARKISGFNQSGNNPMIARNDTTAGNYVMQFVSDIPVAGGLVNQIIVNEKMPNNEAYLIDTSKIALVPYQNRSIGLVDGTLPGQDGITAILRGEYTLKVDSAKFTAGKVTNLAV